jgi:S1-C subfamily serine protease
LTTIDWLIILLCLSAAFAGFRMGFVARSLSWIGSIAGLVAALLVLPSILRQASDMSPTGRLSIVVLIGLTGLLLGQMLGLFAGSRLASSLPPGPLRNVDRACGAMVGVFGVLVFVWILVPIAANVPGWASQQARQSVVAQGVYNNAPKAPNFSETVRKLVGSSSFPLVFNDLNPSIDTGPPPDSLVMSADAVARVKASTVKVEGTACRRTQDGSGFAVAPGVVVTNAHVVAGERSTKIFDAAGNSHNATLVAYDPARDLAVLRASTYSAPALPIREADEGDEGAVFGHPGGQDEVSIAPAKVHREITAVGRDLYDTETTRRKVLVLAAQLAQGDSGGPLVNRDGEVIGVAFAIAPDKPGTSYALDVDELKAMLEQPLDTPVSAGACVND